MKLVAVIPALNEEKTVAGVIKNIPAPIAGITETAVIVIDDGSNDNTAKLAEQAGATVVRHSHNQGVGAAFHTGIEAALKAGADIIVNMDADGQFNPKDLPTLIQPILSGKADFVTATRFAKEKWFPAMPPIKVWGNRQMVRVINAITGKNFTDVSCGFRAYSREAALRLTLFGRFTYTHETFIDLAFKNIAMTEVPLKIRGEREFGESRVASNLWRFGTKAASIIFRAARDYKPFYFFGIPGIAVFTLGVASSLFLVVHYLSTGRTAPFRSLVIVSGTLLVIGFLILVMSMLADMLHRNRVLIEQQLYLTRKNTYGKK
ncbi:MAG: glycosyltransferase family 2 protein [Patescibacteria group bacterium]